MAVERLRSASRLLVLAASCLGLSGCLAWQTPANPGDLAGNGYMAERRQMPVEPRETVRDAIAWNLSRCDVTERIGGSTLFNASDAPVLSPGDLLRITAPGNEAPSGMYEVGNDGVIALEGVGPLRVIGLTQREAEALLNRRLVAIGWFRAQHARVALSLLERGPLRVVVAGAVFQPGRVVINQRAAQDTDTAR